MRHCAIVLLVLVLVACGATTASASPYLIDLGTMGYTGTNVGSMAYGINNNGVVVGRAFNSDGINRPFIWQSGVMTDMDPINGNPAYSWEADPGKAGTGYAINNNGYTTGNAKTLLGNHAFLYTGSPSTSIDIYPSPNAIPQMPGPENCTGYGINDSGQVVGVHGGADAPVATAAFLYSSSAGTKIELNSLIAGATASTAYAINSAGWVVGNYSTASSYNIPFLYNGSTMSDLTMFAGVTAAQPKSINGSNHVVGTATASDGKQYGFYNNGTTTVQLGTLGGNYSGTASDARAVNSSNQIVGLSIANGGTTINDRRAVQFNLDGTVTDLNTLITVAGSGWTLSCATGINDSGWICGWGTNPAGQQRPFLLKALLPGDANLDGTVNINDLSVVLTNYDKSGMTWAQGDFDANGTVDISDLSKVLTSYDKSVGTAAGITAVPEPGVMALLTISAAGLAIYARKKR
jgi:probable HAF family extracellular repeat protein